MDAAGITAFMQSSSGDDDDDMGAPDAAVYESSSGGIIDTLNGLLEKGETQLNTATATETTTKTLNEDLNALGSLHMDCMTKAQDFEAETTSRGEELKALAMAKKAVVENTSGAGGQTYSFMQLSTSSDLHQVEAVQFIKNLAKKHNEPALAQLASRISSAIKLSHGAD